MSAFSQESVAKLATCHTDLQTLFNRVILLYNCTILEGHRSQADQEADFKAGKTQLHWPNGKHDSMPSMAVDVAPDPVSFDDSMVNIERFYLFAGYVLGVADGLKEIGKITHSIRWGGDWNGDRTLANQKFNDLVHFELV